MDNSGFSDSEEFIAEIPGFRCESLTPPLEEVEEFLSRIRSNQEAKARKVILEDSGSEAEDENAPLDQDWKPPRRALKGSKQFRAWVFTMFAQEGETEEDFLVASQILFEKWKSENLVTELVAGKEVCPSTGRLHLQGFVRWAKPMSFAAVRKMNQNFWNPSNSPEKAKIYCRKDGQPLVDWDFRYKRSGNSKSLIDAELAQAVLRGDPTGLEAQLGFEWMFHNCKKVNDALTLGPAMLGVRMDRVIPLCVWIMGESGTGKTMCALSLLQNLDMMDHCHTLMCSNSASTTWFDGLNRSHQALLVDDVTASQLPPSLLLKLVSPSVEIVPVKGGSRYFFCRVIIMTSTVAPWDCYKQSMETDLMQVIRRVHVLIHLKLPDNDPVVVARLAREARIPGTSPNFVECHGLSHSRLQVPEVHKESEVEYWRRVMKERAEDPPWKRAERIIVWENPDPLQADHMDLIQKMKLN